MPEETANPTTAERRNNEVSTRLEEGLESSKPLKRRKLNEEVHSDTGFSWIGPILWIGPASRGRKQTYKSFRLHGITYFSKDFAYIFSRPGIPYDIVQLLQLWQNNTSGKYARVRRFCRLEQNYRYSDISSEQTGELFATEIFDDVNLDCIKGKCTVQYVPIEKRLEFEPHLEKDNFFFSMYLNPVDGVVYAKKEINIQIITPLHLIFQQNQNNLTQAQLEHQNVGNDTRPNGTQVLEQENSNTIENAKFPASKSLMYSIGSENSAFSPPKHRRVLYNPSDSEQTQEFESQATPEEATIPSLALETNEPKPLEKELNDQILPEDQAQPNPEIQQTESHVDSNAENEQPTKSNSIAKDVVHESSPSDAYDPLKDEILLGSDREIIIDELDDSSKEGDREEVLSSRRLRTSSSDTEEAPIERPIKKLASPSSSVKSSPQIFLSDSDTSSPRKPLTQSYEDIVYSSRRRRNGASSKASTKKDPSEQDTQYFSSKSTKLYRSSLLSQRAWKQQEQRSISNYPRSEQRDDQKIAVMRGYRR